MWKLPLGPLRVPPHERGGMVVGGDMVVGGGGVVVGAIVVGLSIQTYLTLNPIRVILRWS